MTNKPLSASPLHILSHRFTRLEVIASEDESPSGGMSLTTTRQFARDEKQTRDWKITLDIKFGSSDGDPEKSPYSGRLVIEGEFRVVDAYPEDKIQALIEVTGSSILYGACREMLANLTARSTHGMISLPSVSFLEAPVAPKKVSTPKKKSAKKSSSKP